MPVVFSIHCPHWLLMAEPWQEAYSCKVKPEVRTSKAHMGSGGHSHRLLSNRAERGQKEWTVTGSFLNIDTRTVLKLSLIVASCTDELLCILAFIRSDPDRGNVGRRQFSNLEKLLEDIKSFLRDEDDSAFPSSFSHLLWLMCLQASSCVASECECECACLQLFDMHLCGWDMNS